MPPKHLQVPQRRHAATLDAIDRRLCEILADNPHATRRELAQAVGVTDDTVTIRLRSLRQQNVIATTVVVDWQAAGFQAAAILRCTVRDDDPIRAVRPVLNWPRVAYVGLTTGCCDLVIAVLAADLGELRNLVAELRTACPAIEPHGVDMVIDAPFYNPRSHTLPIVSWSPEEFPNPVIELDDLDRALIRLLSTAGDESNRELARRLRVSDATIRTRLRRLEDANLVRVVTARDPIAYGDLTAHALCFVDLVNTDALAELANVPGIQSCYTSVAASDAVVVLAASNETELAKVITRDVRRIHGVSTLEVAHVVSILQHRTHLGRLVDAPQPASAERSVAGTTHYTR